MCLNCCHDSPFSQLAAPNDICAIHSHQVLGSGFNCTQRSPSTAAASSTAAESRRSSGRRWHQILVALCKQSPAQDKVRSADTTRKQPIRTHYTISSICTHESPKPKAKPCTTKPPKQAAAQKRHQTQSAALSCPPQPSRPQSWPPSSAARRGSCPRAGAGGGPAARRGWHSTRCPCRLQH